MSFKLPSFLPQENKFNALLSSLTEEALTCATELEIFICTADEKERENASQTISKCRENAKVIAAHMTQALCQTFVTPFDREDIQDFSSLLYRIPKIIEKTKDRIEMYGLNLQKGDFIPQVQLIAETSKSTSTLVSELIAKRGGKQIQQRVTTLYDLEHKGDLVLSQLLVNLFNSDANPRELILHKDIYDLLEKVIDLYRDAGGVALRMALKYL